MKNVLTTMVLGLVLVACGGKDVEIKPEKPSGNGGSGGSVGNGGSGGNAGECCNGDGTRLTRQYLVGDDGSRMEMPIWHDNDLDLNCSFQSLPNGQTYCVPPHEAVSTYFDAGCVIPAYVEIVNKGQALDCFTFPSHVRYGHVNSAGVCGAQGSDNFTIFRVNPDKLIARSSVSYEKDVQGGCKILDLTSNPFQEWALWEVLEVGPLSSFVKAVSGVGF